MTMFGPLLRRGLACGGALLVSLLPGPIAGQEPDPIEAGVRAPDGRYDDGLDVLSYDVELALTDRSSEIWGRARIRARAVRDGVAAMELDFTGLAIESATVDGVEVTVTGLAEGRPRLAFPATAAEGNEIDVVIEYSGTPDDGLLIRNNVEGRFGAFVDNWPNRTRFWLPSKDHPSDKATIRFTVHAPAQWEVIANGRLIGQPIPTGPGESYWPEGGERRTWIYASDVPHPTYTMVIGATEMVVEDLGLAACGLAPASPRPDGCVEVSQWLYPGSVESGSPSFVRAVEMLDFFAEIFGPFPYEKLAHVQSSTRFGGMENSSAIFYSEQALASGADMEGTVSHEIVHQWFGDSATEADWGHLWLSEGFATYFGAVYFEFADGIDDFRGRIQGVADRYLASGDTIRPVVDTETQNLFGLLNRNSYQKGGMVLHMLRGVMGNEPFFAGVREYYSRYRDATALTADFQAVMEEQHGQSLDWFFDQWLNEPGYPVLEVDTRAGATGGLQVDLTQIQGDYAPRFRLPLTIEFRSGDTVLREDILMDGASGSWFFSDVPSDAEVVVDPDGWVLKRIAN